MPVFSRFRGINNQRSAEQMPVEDLAGCVNLMVNDDGALVARPGMTQVWSGQAHSIVEFDGTIYFRSGGSLLRADTGTVVDAGLGNGATCYTQAPGALLYSDGERCRMLEGGVATDWGLTPPSFSVVGSGDTQITATYIRGRYESGAATPGAVGPSTTITIPPIAGATHKAVYMSMPGGEVLRRVAVVPIDHPAFVVEPSDSGPELQTLHKTPPPPHRVSTVRNGRAVIGVGAFVLYSDAFRFDLFDPIRQSIPFPADVTMLASVSQDTLIVGTKSAVYRLSGADMDSVSVVQIADFGAIEGAHTLVDASLFSQSLGLAVVFATTGGFCRVSQDGGVTNITGEKFRPGQFAEGSSCFFHQPGNHSVLFSLRH